jgi:hypothetical protein
MCGMQKDQDLYNLFRTYLPIAPLPQAFTDRLTKTILEEVATLRQTNTFHPACPPEQTETATPFNPSTQSAPYLPVNYIVSLSLLLWLTYLGVWFTVADAAFIQPSSPIHTGQTNLPVAMQPRPPAAINQVKRYLPSIPKAYSALATDKTATADCTILTAYHWI